MNADDTSVLSHDWAARVSWVGESVSEDAIPHDVSWRLEGGATIDYSSRERSTEAEGHATGEQNLTGLDPF